MAHRTGAPDQEASAGINQNLGVAKYLQGRLIDRQQPEPLRRNFVRAAGVGCDGAIA